MRRLKEGMRGVGTWGRRKCELGKGMVIHSSKKKTSSFGKLRVDKGKGKIYGVGKGGLLYLLCSVLSLDTHSMHCTILRRYHI